MGHSGTQFIHAEVSLLQGHCHIMKEILPWIEILMSFRFRVFLLGQCGINTLIYSWRFICFNFIVLSLLVRLKSFSYVYQLFVLFLFKILKHFTLFFCIFYIISFENCLFLSFICFLIVLYWFVEFLYMLRLLTLCHVIQNLKFILLNHINLIN